MATVDPAPRDIFDRPMRDLRISVTDRCNFRCRYCMPREVFGADYAFLPRSEILSFEELTRVARAFIGLGVEKIRITGGEPLLRRNLDSLIGSIASETGVRDLALTTNGSLLAGQAATLRAAGLTRLTVSLDALDETAFAAMNDTRIVPAQVLRGIDAAIAAGFSPIKINMVVKRGANEHCIPEMVRRFDGPEFILRFIEYMDVGSTNGWRTSEVVPAAEILERIREVTSVAPLNANYNGEVARRFQTSSGGEIGIISSVSQPFCRDCTRARLTADGRLFTCLFAASGFDLKGILRSGATDIDLRKALGGHWRARSDRYSELRSQHSAEDLPKAEMSLLGG